MAGVGEPQLIVEGSGSPHTYSLKPSQAAALQEADLVFWVGRDLEPFLEKPIETIGENATIVGLLDAEGLKVLSFREGASFEPHDHAHADEHDDHAHADEHDDHAHADEHDDHAHADEHDDHAHADEHDDHAHADEHDDHAHADEHDDHAHADEHDDHAHADEHDDHAHADEHDDHAHADEHDDHAHADEHDHASEVAEVHDDHDHHHDHGAFDPHVWLDPVNAKALVSAIEDALSQVDPENATAYSENADQLRQRLDALVAEVDDIVAPVKDQSFVPFHDAYLYFEDRFGVRAAGAITVSPEVVPGAARVGEIKDRIVDLEVTCVFAEPQFTPSLVATVTEGTGADTGVLDPLGTGLDDGPDLYFSLIRAMAESMRDCLTPTG
ncbi:metal ABC transporter solute-binding protein, Zn/Mn family [Bauldia sp.]|uniref:zinc ABC transporter substrate-binding protein n=1 Tax=Bauldia sp. TaxID=2575872 RepID=UPI003BAB1558